MHLFIYYLLSVVLVQDMHRHPPSSIMDEHRRSDHDLFDFSHHFLRNTKHIILRAKAKKIVEIQRHSNVDVRPVSVNVVEAHNC